MGEYIALIAEIFCNASQYLIVTSPRTTKGVSSEVNAYLSIPLLH